MVAYAVPITLENMGAIASEKPDFNREEFLSWIEDHGTGFFVRDPGTVFDCEYFDPKVFLEIYIFEKRSDANELFRQISRI